MSYSAIIVGGLVEDLGGRPLGPYLLRTTLEKNHYPTLVIDSAWAMTSEELLALFQATVTQETLIIGISSVWFTALPKKDFKRQFNEWLTPEFFNTVKQRWPWAKIVMGGTKVVNKWKIPTDYEISGFADIGLVKLLDYLSGKDTAPINLQLTTRIKSTEKFYALDCDKNYPVKVIDDLETEWRKEDAWLPHQPMPLEVSRGCIFKCSFCDHPFLGKKTFEYIRSTESLASELQKNYEMFGTTRYTIVDDTFNDSVEKIQRVLKARDLSKIPNFEFTSHIRPELLVTKPDMHPLLAELGLKGGFVGIESFGKEARAAVGKGMEIDRVMATLAEVKEKYGVRWQAGFIVGLPGDTIDNCFEYLERLKTEKVISIWNFYSLIISHMKYNAESLFQKDPQQYGFKIQGRHETGAANWTNNCGVTTDQAIVASKKLGELGEPYMTAGGWFVSHCWYHDIAAADIKNKPLNQIDLRGLGAVTGRRRAETLLEKFNIKK